MMSSDRTQTTLMNSRTKFNGPSDRKQYYIGSFLAKLSDSNKQHNDFTKNELVEIHSALRKEAPSCPWLFRLIQTVVDEAVFLDPALLEFQNEKSHSVLARLDYSENQVAEYQQVLDEQLEFKRLLEFNRCRIDDRSSLLADNRNEKNCRLLDSTGGIETLIECQSLSQEVEELNQKSVESDEENRDIQNSIRDIVKRFVACTENLDQALCQTSETLKTKLESDMEDRLVEYLIRKCNGTLPKPEPSFSGYLESDEKIKRRYLALHETLTRMHTRMADFVEILSVYEKHRQFRDDLQQIKHAVARETHRLIMDSGRTGPPAYETKARYAEMVQFFRDNRHQFNYDRVIRLMEQYSAEIVVLQSQLERDRQK